MIKQDQHPPNKKMKLTLAGLVQQPFEQTQKPVEERSTFRIVTIDGGKTLSAELTIPRLCLWPCVRVKLLHKLWCTMTNSVCPYLDYIYMPMTVRPTWFFAILCYLCSTTRMGDSGVHVRELGNEILPCIHAPKVLCEKKLTWMKTTE